MSVYTGLTSEQAAARLAQEGYNELAPPRRRNLFTSAIEVLREPMLSLLLASGAVYLILGSPRDALLLLASALVIIGITLYQSHKTERVLSALRDLSSPRALVMRDGKAWRIAGREVVRDDIMLLNEGDRVPADAALLSCNDF
ncbi:MAG TPA: cation-transporting P-type ATPase, partial [Acidiferrobacterales bacterium]|nr:cation-transporting P-type ATPase [Acidiferrobacterales bacterium]